MKRKRRTICRILGLLMALLLTVMQPVAALATGTDEAPAETSDPAEPQETVAEETTAAAVASGETGDLSWTLDDEGVFTLSGTGATGSHATNETPWDAYMSQIKKVVIEEGVTELGKNLFYGASSLVDVAFSDTVTTIGSSTFRGTGLTALNITAPVTYIGQSAFRECPALESVVLPATLESMDTVVFYNCTALRSATVYENDGELAARIFEGCAALETVVISEKITSLGDSNTRQAFNTCENLTTITYGGTIEDWKTLLDTNTDGYLKNTAITVTCSDGTYNYDVPVGYVVTITSGNIIGELDTGIGELAITAAEDSDGASLDYGKAADSPFYAYVSQIKTIKVESGVTYLGNYLLRGAAATSVNFPETLTGIGNSCFRDTNLTEVTLPDSLNSLDTYAFMGCKSLTSVVIGSGLTTLKERTFGNGTALKSVTIPASVTVLETSENNNVDRTAFNGCTDLTEIHYGGTAEQWEALIETLPENNDGVLRNTELVVYCTDGYYVYGTGLTPAISGVTGDVTWSLNMETGVLTLTANDGGEGKTGDYLKDTTSPLYDYASQISQIVVEEGVTYLGKGLFRYAAATSVSLPNTLTHIAEACFRQCNELTAITIPESVSTLERVALYSCAKLETVVLQGTYTALKDKLMQKCASVKELWIPGTVAVIEASALSGLGQLKTIHYGGTVEQWVAVLNHADSAGASSVKKDAISVVCTDGTYVYGYVNIENGLSYSLSGGVLTIRGQGAMADYEKGESPWTENAESITSVVIHNGVTRIGAYAFADCINIEEVTYIGSDEEWETLKEASGERNEPLFDIDVTDGTTGECGESVTWKFDPETGLMTISGTGAMEDYEASSKEAPWANLLNDITAVVVEDGITSVGMYAFQNCKNIKTLTLATSVETIGSYSFGTCTGLTELRVPEGVRVIGAKAFTNCSAVITAYLPSALEYVDMKAFDAVVALTDVYYNGTQTAWEKVTISNQAQGNAYLLNATLHTVAAEPNDYEDVSNGIWYEDDIQYLVEQELIAVEGTTFEPDALATTELILDALYIRGGSPGMFDGAGA